MCDRDGTPNNSREIWREKKNLEKKIVYEQKLNYSKIKMFI